MGFNCGIVGLPNVGKSTLFNALTATAAAEAANYPFCTIEPNIGRVAVPDPRLEILARLAKSQKIVPTQLEFVDIAGLVRGASQGEGLGNQFLAHIREVDAIAHVVRCFADGNVTHVEGSIDPVRDAETVETELMLADLDGLERRAPNLQKRAKVGDKEAKALLEVLEPALAALREGQPARTALPADPDQRKLFQTLNLITAKPVVYVCNVDEAGARHRRRGDLGRDRSRGRRARGRGRQSRVSRKPRPRRNRADPGDPRRLWLARPRHLLHRRPQGNPRLDRAPRIEGAPSRRGDPHRFREGLHPRRNHRL
jgi:GTP-binding protein YchF